MLYTRKQLLEWKRKKTVFYLSKPQWNTTYTEDFKKKAPKLRQSKVGKTKWYQSDKTSENAGIIKSKKYIIYFDATDKKAGTITLDGVHDLTRNGIKVLAEKGGFAC